MTTQHTVSVAQDTVRRTYILRRWRNVIKLENERARARS